MKIADIRERAFAMPFTSPAFPPGPYRFVNREFLIVTYRTDPDALRAVVPELLEIVEPIVKYEFIRMPGYTIPEDLSDRDRHSLELAITFAKTLPFDEWAKLGLVRP